MRIVEVFKTVPAQTLETTLVSAQQAINEVATSIIENANLGHEFVLNNTVREGNGVVRIKDGCYRILEERFDWYREKPLHAFKKRGGPIDAYKEFPGEFAAPFRVGLEFETGNVSSAHRAMNKLLVGIKSEELDMGMLMLPMKTMYDYLTGRTANYEEIEPYFTLLKDVPFIVFGFAPDRYDANAPFLPKGKEGMSKRSIKKWPPGDNRNNKKAKQR